MSYKLYKLGWISFVFMCLLSLPIFTSAQQPFLEMGIELIPYSDDLRPESRFAILSSNTLGDLYRYPAEEKRWLQMVNATAYFRDVLAGPVTYISGATDGETWTGDILLPDGATRTWSPVTFYRTYNGQSNCFVTERQVLCGSTSAILLWWRIVQCQPIGLWVMNFYNNSNYLFSTQFTLLPQIYPNKVPLYNQFAYTDAYDKICRTRTETGQLLRDVFPCDGRPNEVPWTIVGKGCYLTDATMILRYHGVNIDPPTLNAWLINNNGYRESGDVYPNKVAEYARQQGVNITYNPPEPDPQTVWSGLDELERYICYYGHHIIKVSNRNHWVTATGKNSLRTVYLANDPEGGVPITLPQYADKRTFGGPEYTYTDSSGLTISFHSPGELLLIDPQGRRVGYDPRTGQSYNEIPGAHYGSIGLEDAESGDPGPETKEIEVPRPLAGDYQLQVIGTDTGTYTLELMSYNPDLKSSLKKIRNISITPDAVHTYGFYYAKTVPELEFKAIPGNFDGMGQRPSDVNKFLSYVTPTQSTTELSAGTTSFSLVVVYDKNIIPSAFTAELNGVNVKSLFNPTAGGAESVTLKLNQGRNTLVLSVEGNLPNRVAKDTDRLVFIVP